MTISTIMENFTHLLVTVGEEMEYLDSHSVGRLQTFLHDTNLTDEVTHNDVTNYVAHNTSRYATGSGLPMPLHITVGVLMVIVSLVGTIGNILVIIVFGRSLQKPINRLLINLAVADLVMAGLGSPVVVVSSFHGNWVLGDIGCTCYAFLMGQSGLVSIVTMSAVALERVCGVASYKHKSPLQRCGAPCTIAFIWCYSSLWVLPPLFGWGKYTVESHGTSCSFKFLDATQEDRSFLLYLFVGGFVVPCCIIFVSYLLLCSWVMHNQRALQRQAERMNTSVNLMRRNSHFNVELRVTKVCGLVVLLFLIAWVPYATITLLAAFGGKAQQALITPLVCLLPGVFAKVSSIYNPILYAMSHPAFKRHLWHLICNRRFSDSPGLPTYTQALTVPTIGVTQSSQHRRQKARGSLTKNAFCRSGHRVAEEECRELKNTGSDLGEQGLFLLDAQDTNKISVVLEAECDIGHIPEAEEDLQLITDEKRKNEPL